MEEIKIVPNYEWCAVDRQGNLYSTRRKFKKFSLYKDKDGYAKASTKVSGKTVRIFAHRAVVLAFLGEPEGEANQVNHINSIRDDNRLENLEWVTPKENQEHRWKYGNNTKVFGEDTSNYKYPEHLIRNICSLIEQGFRNATILKRYPNIDVKLPSDVRNRRSWTHISSEYKLKHIRRGRLSERTVRYICRSLEAGLTPKQIVSNSTNAAVTTSVVRHIKSRRVYKDIIQDYNF